MIKEFLDVLGTGLKLWNTKEGRKYQDEYIKLRREYYEEDNKPLHERDDAVLDLLRYKLLVLGTVFAAGASKPDTSDQP